MNGNNFYMIMKQGEAVKTSENFKCGKALDIDEITVEMLKKGVVTD